MRKKNIKTPKYTNNKLKNNFKSGFQKSKSLHSALGAQIKLPYSKEAYDSVCDISSNLLKTQKEMNVYMAETLSQYEQEIEVLRASVEFLKNKNKGLVIELRRSMKIKSKKEDESQDTDKDDSTDNTSNNDEKEDSNKKSKKRGAPKGHRGKSRSVPLEFNNEKIVLPPEKCSCGCCDIVELDEFDSKYIEDIKIIVKEITRVKYLRGRCVGCGRILRSKEGVNGPPVVIGENLQGMFTMLREYGMTLGKLSSLSTDMLNIPLTRSGVLGILNRTIDKLEPFYETLRYQLPKEKKLNMDETTWKVRTDSGYIWVFCNDKIVYFHHVKSRAGQVVLDILGTDYKGIAICDFYGAYNVLEKKQRCLVHFLKDIKKQCDIYKGSKSLINFKEKFKAFIKHGLEIQAMKASVEKTLKIEKLGNTLDAITKIQLPKGDPGNLTKRILKYKDEMMLFVKHPGVDYHNNKGESTLRPLVISRNNSFGSDTDAGAKRICQQFSVKR